LPVADKSVSLDLLVPSLLSLGATRRDVANALGARIATLAPLIVSWTVLP
jgi:hypothetical protein